MSTQPRSIASVSVKQIPLSRRILFPNLNPANPLPPLLASPVSPELTAELYDFIALALRAFVNPWWTKITRYDKEFLPEINRILRLTIRSLEDRALAADLLPIVFRDIPTLVSQHYRDYRNAASKVDTAYANGTATPLPHLFHQLQPHIALTPTGQVQEEYFRQIVDHILKTSLPLEDYEPEAERFIIREIVLKVLLQDVIPKISQPWFIHQTLLDLLEPWENKPPKFNDPKSPASLSRHHSSHFSFHTLLVILLSAIQAISGACLTLVHAYKSTISTIKLVNQSPSLLSSVEPTPPHPPIPEPPTTISAASSTSSLLLPHPTPRISPPGDYSRAPIDLFSELFTTSDRFAATALVSTISMLSTSLSPFLDRLLPHLLFQSLSYQFLTSLVIKSKHTLFPNGYLSPTPPDPSPEEQTLLREQLLSWRPRNKATSFMMSLLIGESGEGNEARGRETMEAAIDAFGWRECNVHLVVLVIDRIVLGLWPELGAGGGGVTAGGNGHGGKKSGVITPVTPPETTRPYGL